MVHSAEKGRIKQEPGANGTEILNTLKYVRPGRGFVPNFPLLEKSESVCPPDIDTFFTENCRIFYHPIRTRDVHYNFEKFLINKRGRPVLRFSHNYPPEEIQRDIYTLLQED
ncbi:hypothetical protein KUTeg_020961 [Tegillarca granosa]|uniref:Glutathione peroxidase n=1 Tax=Tegillarca granosa TaxID=220873 RepID=A0ABQ9E9F5_TEGGR|nr:hypothetical protein KUTeg_020961 [Tegillarca granosa]